MVCSLGWAAAGNHSVAADTDDSQREPILRIETGMHIAGIISAAMDAENNYLVTGSYDKTIRVWKLPSARLVRVIRPPIGDGDDGKLTALGVSPNGRTIAAGLHGPPDGETVEIFDLQTGKLEKHLEEVNATPLKVAFSGDGRYLAVTQYFGEALLFDANNYKLLAEDKDCAQESYGAAFDAQDRLITTCYDGFIRGYEVTKNGSLQLMVKETAPSGKLAHPVAVSPDGSEIAIGYEGTPKIDVLSMKDFSFLFAPEMPRDGARAMNGLSWSTDGKTLYAGGERLEGIEPVRAWANGGRGAYEETPASDNTITQILPLRSGGVVFAGFTPSFGIVDSKGVLRLNVGRPIADYRADPKGFLLSEDGATVQFSYEFGGKAPAQFSLSQRRLDTAPAGSDGLKPAAVERFFVTDWRNNRAPKLNGKPLPTMRGDTSRSLAIMPDRTRFLLGTDWFVTMFGTDGTPRWTVPSPATTWCLNISGDGKLAAAAFGDGSIHWYRITDGEELLAFFPASDRKRWVIWTPSGYYDASPGGEELIGWHVNNGRDNAADFFPVGQFRSTYYRPDIVAKILETGDEAQAILATNEVSGRKTRGASLAQMLPPVVEIVSPSDGGNVSTPNISVRYAVRSPSGEPLTDVRVMLDGRPASAARGVSKVSAPGNGDVLEATVSVPPRDATVSVIASNRYASSAPATVHLHWRGTDIGAPDIKPKLYVLAVGVSQYGDASLRLHYAAKDAQDFAAALERQKGGLYGDVRVKVLTDDKANRDDVAEGLDWISKATTSSDVAMILLSGHGVNDQSGKYFFLPHDANVESLLRTGVSMDQIRTAISSIAGKTLFFVDTCHSGNVVGGRKDEKTDVNGLINELASAENGAIVFAASSGTQSSIEDPAWSNGAFTKSLVEGINGRAEVGGSNQITVLMLELYISQRVKELTQDQQTPMTQNPNMVSDYPVALKQ